ncbi:MAG: Ig-like domain-containing protein [Blautia sp.]|nr:Ig-like domain-containing protein [Blautia sp.]
MKNKKIRELLAGLLAAAMVVTALPVAPAVAYAQDGQETQTPGGEQTANPGAGSVAENPDMVEFTKMDDKVLKLYSDESDGLAGCPQSLEEFGEYEVVTTAVTNAGSVTSSGAITVSGSLEYVKDFTGFNEDEDTEQEGYYLPLQFLVKAAETEEDGESNSTRPEKFSVTSEGEKKKDFDQSALDYISYGDDNPGNGWYFSIILYMDSTKGQEYSFTVDLDGDGDSRNPVTYTLDYSGLEFKDKQETEKVAVKPENDAEVTIKESSELTYGAKLSTLKFADVTFVTDDESKTKVEGTLAWTEDIVPEVGTTTAEWTFTPNDKDTYAPATGTVGISVTKAAPEVEAPTVATVDYNPAKTLADVEFPADAKGTWTVGDNENTEVPGAWTWEDSSIVPTVTNESYTAVFTPTDTKNYKSVEKTVTVTVNPAETAPNTPASTKSVLNEVETVGAVELPDGWKWKENDRGTALTVGTSVTATAVYTGSDAANYTESACNVSVVITRLAAGEKLPASITVTTDSITKKFGDAAFSIVEAAGIIKTEGGALSYTAAVDEDENAAAAIIEIATDGTVTIKKPGMVKIIAKTEATEQYSEATSQKIALTINKADAPAIDAIAKSYLASTGTGDAAASLDIAALLPADRGTTDYTMVETDDSGIIVDDSASVDTDGILTYQVVSGTVGNSASITVKATSECYEDITVTVTITLSDKQSVQEKTDAEVAVVAGEELTYGSKLGDLPLNVEEAKFVTDDGTEVAGALAWKDGESVPAAGEHTVSWIFTPDDDSRYEPCEGTLVIVVKKATPVVSAPAGLEITYDPDKTIADVSLPADGTGTWSVNDADVEVHGTWAWKNSDAGLAVENDGYTAVFTPDSGNQANYDAAEVTVTVVVNPATPYITLPTVGSITYGQIVADAVLTGGAAQHSEENEASVAGSFEWIAADKDKKPTVTADSGTTEYTLVFKPDSENYSEVSAKVTITVNKAQTIEGKPNTTMSVDNSYDTVKKITLPTGWAWQDSTIALTAGGETKAVAVYVGDDKDNYEDEARSIEVTITRAKATGGSTGGTTSGGGSTGGSSSTTVTTPATSTETKPDGTKVETTTETKTDGTKVETTTETKTDGTKTETTTETKTDGTKTETTTETKADGTVSKTTETVTKADGSATKKEVEATANKAGAETTVTTTTKTNAAGAVTSVTEKTEIPKSSATTSTVVTVKKDGTGAVTSAKATVENTVTGNKSTVSAAVVSQITEAAGTENVKITMTVKDSDGNTKYKVKVDTEDLESGNELYIYKLNTTTGEYTMVNAKTYTVNSNGSVSVSASKKATYELVNADEAAAINKEIKATIKPKKTSVTVKKGKKTNFTLSSKVNKDNIKSITYTTSNKSVATVNKNGKITSKKSGTVTIKAKVTLKNGTTKTIKIKVKVK